MGSSTIVDVIIPAYLEEANISFVVNDFKNMVNNVIVTNKISSDKTHIIAEENGANFLDAPLSGGQAGAESGQLTIMVGGDIEVYEFVLGAIENSSIQNDFKLSNHGLVLESFDKFYKSRNE